MHGVASAPSGATVDGAAAAVAYDAGQRQARVSLPADGNAHRIELVYDASALPTAPETQPSQLRFVVALPPSTPAADTIYLAGDPLSSPAWKPDGLALVRSGSTATATLPLPPGTQVAFKVTRGSWASVEKQNDCAEQGNRTARAPATACNS